MERKFIGREFKAEGDRKAAGYGAVFGNEDLGGDIIAPGAFVGLGSRRVRMLRDHDSTKVIGVWEKVEQDDVGLRVEGMFADTPLGNETRELVRTRALEGLSIGYRTLEADRGSDGARILKAIELWEVSAVTFPMNEAAGFEAAKAFAAGNSAPFKRILEEAARDAGCSAREAKAVAAAGASQLQAMRDDGGDLSDLAAHMRRIMSST